MVLVRYLWRFTLSYRVLGLKFAIIIIIIIIIIDNEGTANTSDIIIKNKRKHAH